MRWVPSHLGMFSEERFNLSVSGIKKINLLQSKLSNKGFFLQMVMVYCSTCKPLIVEPSGVFTRSFI